MKAPACISPFYLSHFIGFDFSSRCNSVLRHMHAQTRYEELTGWKAPKAGGPSTRDLSEQQRQIDREARLQISEELGHERIEVTNNYLGSKHLEESTVYVLPDDHD